MAGLFVQALVQVRQFVRLILVDVAAGLQVRLVLALKGPVLDASLLHEPATDLGIV